MKIPFDAAKTGPARRADALREERNQQIRMRYLAGETLHSIGASFALSGERIRKIVMRYGLNKSNAGLAVRNRDKPRKPDVPSYSCRVYGCTMAELDQVPRRWRQAFLQQRTNVRRAGTVWLLSLTQWVEIWVRSGKWAERGQGPSRYGLSRIDPVGSFSADNVQVGRNHDSAMRGRSRKAAGRQQAPNPSGNSWIREMAKILKDASAANGHRPDTAK
jgi:hypothetical protein